MITKALTFIVRHDRGALGIHRLPDGLPGLSLNLRAAVRPRSVNGGTGQSLAYPRTAVLVALAAFCFSTSRGQAQSQTAAPSAARHVVVISVDGMAATWYTAPPPGLRIPNIRRLTEGGSYAEGVEGVYPTVTYPAHTTLVTGRPPAEHGVYTNLSSREPGKNPGDWFWFSSAIKVPTLWDEARRAHLSTASVAWPVTAGAPIDWDIPEIWDPQKGEVADPLYVAKYMNPLVALELAALGAPEPGSDTDVDRSRLAVYLLKSHKPNLLLVHFETLDMAEHASGPESPKVAETLERIDAHIGEVLAAVKQAGLESTTDVFIVSDHGFLPIDRDVAPNVLLAKAGLLAVGNPGKGTVFTVSNGGSFFVYWPEGQDLRAAVDAALKPLRDRGLVWSVLDRQALKDLGADPGAQMALDAADGSSLSGRLTGELVERLGPHGTHGFLPFRQGLEASFIASGPGIKPGAHLHYIRMTSIGPTILRALGIDDPKFGDDPPLQGIFE